MTVPGPTPVSGAGLAVALGCTLGSRRPCRCLPVSVQTMTKERDCQEYYYCSTVDVQTLAARRAVRARTSHADTAHTQHRSISSCPRPVAVAPHLPHSASERPTRVPLPDCPCRPRQMTLTPPRSQAAWTLKLLRSLSASARSSLSASRKYSARPCALMPAAVAWKVLNR